MSKNIEITPLLLECVLYHMAIQHLEDDEVYFADTKADRNCLQTLEVLGVIEEIGDSGYYRDIGGDDEHCIHDE